MGFVFVLDLEATFDILFGQSSLGCYSSGICIRSTYSGIYRLTFALFSSICWKCVAFVNYTSRLFFLSLCLAFVSISVIFTTVTTTMKSYMKFFGIEVFSEVTWQISFYVLELLRVFQVWYRF